MFDTRWQGDGPEFTIEAAGHRWALRVQAADPGLLCQDCGSVGHFLTLQGLSTADRRAEFNWPFGEALSLLAFERIRSRVQATYAPHDWPGLSVRAAWEPISEHRGFDLEVQVVSSSFEVLRGLELTVGSVWIERAHPPSPASSTSDAPGVDGARPSTPRSFPPFFCADPYGVPGRYYAEMVRPGDCVRRLLDAPHGSPSAAHGASIRHVFFGHDLEKGVVLRGRLRALWIDSPGGPPDDLLRRVHEQFLGEPPPLGP